MIYDNTANGYDWVSVFFACVASVGITAGIFIYFIDRMNLGVLDRPEMVTIKTENKEKL